MTIAGYVACTFIAIISVTGVAIIIEIIRSEIRGDWSDDMWL